MLCSLCLCPTQSKPICTNYLFHLLWLPLIKTVIIIILCGKWSCLPLAVIRVEQFSFFRKHGFHLDSWILAEKKIRYIYIYIHTLYVNYGNNLPGSKMTSFSAYLRFFSSTAWSFENEVLLVCVGLWMCIYSVDTSMRNVDREL